MDKLVRKYMETMDKLLTDYAFAGIQALGLVPDFLVQTVKLPQPRFAITFRAAGEVHSYYGTYAQHAKLLAEMAARGNK